MSLNLSLTGAQIQSSRLKKSNPVTNASNNGIPSSRSQKSSNQRVQNTPPQSNKLNENSAAYMKMKASTPARDRQPASTVLSSKTASTKGSAVSSQTISNHSVFVPASARSTARTNDGAVAEDAFEVAEKVRRQRQGGAVGFETFLDLGDLDREAEEVSEWLDRQQLDRSDRQRHDWDEIPVMSMTDSMSMTNSEHFDAPVMQANQSRHGTDEPHLLSPLNNATRDSTLMVGRARSQVNSIDNLRPSSQTRDLVEELIEKCRRQNAAATIQCWWRFRRHLRSTRALQEKEAGAELRRIMSSKRRQLVVNSRTGAEAGRRRHEEAARLERQRAIAELRERRAREAELQQQRKSSASVRSQKSNIQVETQRHERDEAVQLSSDVNAAGGGSAEPMETSRSAVGTKTTLEDILSTLKLLEESPESAERGASRAGQPIKSAWAADIERLLTQDSAVPPASSGNVNLTQSNLQQHLHSFKEESEVGMRIRSFLDDSARPPRSDFSAHSGVGVRIRSLLNAAEDSALIGGMTPRSDFAALESQSTAAVTDVASRVSALQTTLTEREHSLQTLHQELRQQRELNVRNIAETERVVRAEAELRERALQAKLDAADATVSTLVDQNRALQEKTEKLLKLVQETNGKHEKRLKTLTERHEVELAKAKEFHEAGEKVRRERWEQQQTERIKELTMKGMEPEIQRLIAEQRAKIKRIEEDYQHKLMSVQQDTNGTWHRQLDDLREMMARQQDEALRRERETAKRKFDEQLEVEMQGLEAQRRRLYAEVAEDRERAAESGARARCELDADRRLWEAEVARQRDELTRLQIQAREEVERRVGVDMEEFRQRMAAEKASWEETFRKQQQAELLAQERSMRERCKQERDRDIELAICKLEEETSSRVDAAERSAEAKVRRIREKCERELSEMERLETAAREECKAARKQAFELEAELERLRNLTAKKEEEAADIQAMYEKLHRDRKNVADVVRQEFADRLVTTDEENKRLKNELAELRARLSLEQERAQSDLQHARLANEEEMAAVHQKVLEAIKKKEEVVLDMRQRYQRKQDECEHLQALLEQQRKQLASVAGKNKK